MFILNAKQYFLVLSLFRPLPKVYNKSYVVNASILFKVLFELSFWHSFKHIITVHQEANIVNNICWDQTVFFCKTYNCFVSTTVNASRARSRYLNELIGFANNSYIAAIFTNIKSGCSWNFLVSVFCDVNSRAR